MTAIGAAQARGSPTALPQARREGGAGGASGGPHGRPGNQNARTDENAADKKEKHQPRSDAARPPQASWRAVRIEIHSGAEIGGGLAAAVWVGRGRASPARGRPAVNAAGSILAPQVLSGEPWQLNPVVPDCCPPRRG